ncbi:hypothetical protein AQ616_18850 [Oceanobacillus sp. E9]|uniref:hypothetical protein n=1 Tax=Oceanobacillus sp. E9 TaxID=1742575 RepID=UPI00084E55D1|nr:hypothetical protein [Oceanobacillus sp. E9]OEH52964.1 hypothetical protein AQ616_18850 [Oceanobacillus sp. E9]
MKVKAITRFYDKKAKKYRGTKTEDVFEVSQERFDEINSTKYGKLVEEVKEDNFPKHTGGGYYELSNGEKVKGKQKAVDAEKELK